MLKRTLATAAALCMAVGCAAEKTEDLGGMRSATLSSQDNAFIRDLSMGNMTEIQSSQMALQATNNPQVRQMAQNMITDHQAAASSVESIAGAKGARVPTQLDSAHKDMVEALRGKSGDDFDKAYVKLQAKAHEEAINVDQAEADNGTDPDLKATANQLLPVLKKHMTMVHELDAKMSGM